MITAPFNFVPLSEKVFFPDWAEDVSHDVPFEDGESGEIELTITAKSPIFIRDHENPEQFCQHDGKYYIPGSSVKGMVRNVLEIMSFGKISIDDKHEKKYPVRDMTPRSKIVGQASGRETNQSFGYGVLTLKKNGEFTFANYGNKIRLILQSALATPYETYDNVSESVISEKYSQIEPFSPISVVTNDKVQRQGFDKFTVNVDSENGETGELFFGNHINGKHYEFVLLPSDNEKAPTLGLDEEVVKNFKQIYFLNKYDKGNEVGDYWRRKSYSKNGEKRIPVFYKKDDNSITDLGLTQLYKLAYKHTIKEASRQNIEYIEKDKNDDSSLNDKGEVTKEPKLDLAETIFGASRKYLPSLKGRVQFSHFKTESRPQCNKVTTILGSPRPSYYPIYIKQNCNNHGIVGQYNTLMNNSNNVPKISGWKRYSLHYGRPNPIASTQDNNSSTTFYPLGVYNQNGEFEEFIFTGKIRFHNLKKVELGAILSALTFHANQDNFFHNVGMAKPYGYGKVQVDITNFNIQKYIESLEEYEQTMKEEVDENWLGCEEVKELFAMADHRCDIDHRLEYLILNPEHRPSIDNFKDAKNNGKCLKKASLLNENIGTRMPQLVSRRVDKIKKVYTEKKAKKEYENIVIKRNKLLENSVPNNKKLNRAIEAYVINNMDNTNLEVYYDLQAFGVYLTGDASTLADDIVAAYEALYENNFFKERLEDLLVKKYNGTLSDADKTRLYFLLTDEELEDDSSEEFIAKWSLKENHKDSSMILKLVEELNKEQ